jgi:hypothetical protein
MKFLPILLLALFFFIPEVRAQDAPTWSGPLLVQSSESRQVWVNTASGVYHYPGTRWYGKTKQGEFMSKAEAQAHGYRPAKSGQIVF